jgi:hypothetical protein
MENGYAYFSDMPKQRRVYLNNAKYASLTDGVSDEFLPLRMEVIHFDQVKDLPKSFRSGSSSDGKTTTTDVLDVNIPRIMSSSPLRENFEMLGFLNQTPLTLGESIKTSERDDEIGERNVVTNYEPEHNEEYENMACEHRDEEGDSLCPFISADKSLKLGAQYEQGRHAGKRTSKMIKYCAIAKLYREMQDDENERARFRQLTASMLNTTATTNPITDTPSSSTEVTT